MDTIAGRRLQGLPHPAARGQHCAGRALMLAVAVAAAVAPAIAPAAAQEAGAPIGAVETSQGRARAEQPAVVRALLQGDVVLFNDRLTTEDNARLAVTLDDGSHLTLGEKASLTVDRFIYDPQRSKQPGQLAIGVLRGAFLFVGGKVEERNGSKVTIRTSAATLGVRGTTVWGGPIDGGFGVLVLSGRVTVSTPRGRVSLAPGQGTLVDGAGRLDRPAPWGQSRIDRAFAQVSFGSGPGPGRAVAPPAGRPPGAALPGTIPSPAPPAGGGVPSGGGGGPGPSEGRDPGQGGASTGPGGRAK